jgi:N-alpha-acetyl-L-2,4-diaminobutyrate deacetylase
MELNPIQFKAGNQTGKHLLVLGSVHGSEPCGSLAIDKIADMIKQGDLPIHAGTITFLPRANPKAYEQGTRIFEGNLARSIVKKDIADCTYYEERIAQDIIALIEDADYILDLHSCNTQTPAFAFQDNDTPDAAEFCSHLGVDFIIVGWNDYFSNQDIPASVQGYGNNIGKTCATIECGSHHDPASIDEAYNIIINAGQYLGIFKTPTTQISKTTKYRLIHHFWEDAPGELAQDFTGLHFLKKGTHILTYHRNGVEDKYYAEQDCYILMPSKNGYNPDHKNMDIWTYLVAAEPTT